MGSKHAVALLEGFSGTGKSVLAGELSEVSKIPTARVDAFADDENLQNLFLDLAIALEALGIDNLSKEVEKGEGANFASALREVIRHNRVLVIIDEVQHTFLQDVARPPVKLTAVIKQLGSFDAAGKLLLISNRITERDVWSENCFRLRLPPLEESEAVELLSRLLEHQKRSDKVNPDRKSDLVRCLGCNPRATASANAGLNTATALRLERGSVSRSTSPLFTSSGSARSSPLLGQGVMAR